METSNLAGIFFRRFCNLYTARTVTSRRVQFSPCRVRVALVDASYCCTTLSSNFVRDFCLCPNYDDFFPPFPVVKVRGLGGSAPCFHLSPLQ